MPWIENVARSDIPKRLHHDAGVNSMLIQIADPDMDFPQPLHDFRERHFFKFLDIEDGDEGVEQYGVTDEDAARLVQLLQHALERRMNVVVHCTAGVCRSGAVAEVGVMMGFADAERFRAPNLRVKHKMMRVLGWTYDSETVAPAKS